MTPDQSNAPHTTPPTLEEIEAMARAAMATIPGTLLRHVDGVIVQVEEFPDEDTERDLDLDSPFELLGLYRGVSLAEKSVTDIAQDVDMIFLYRRPLLDYWCETGEDLPHLVRHVIIHEIGHHFGFSDDDMDAIEAGT